MPKKKKAGKNSKTKGTTQITRVLIEPDLDSQIFGVLEKALGSRFFDVNCLDGKNRRCKVRNKRMKVKQGDVVIVSLRDFDDKNADIIYKYTLEEVRELQRNGFLPESNSMVSISHNEDEDEECVFNFEDI